MKKNTKLSRLNIRWLNANGLLFMLLGMLLFTFQGQAQTYTYTGSVQTVTLSAGTYEIEMWGADGETAGGQPAGGIGGYSKGTYTVTSSTTIYIGVGGKGNLSPTSGAFAPGGWNGGGQGYASTIVGAGGGGASHVATVTGDLPSLSSNQSAVIIVAGGAGGSGWNGVGGHGGGLIGGNGNSGTGGSTGGTFGQGANGASGSTVGGGGGGWFGGNLGNPGNTGGSGGGSGYIGGVSNGVTIMFGDPGFVSNPDTAGNGTVIITNMAPCTGTPTAGTATVSLGTCYGDPFSLSVSGSTNAGNITYQWQSSPAGTGTWTNIGGATTSSHIVTNQTADTDYRFVVTCTNSSSSDTSNVVNVALAPTGNFSENFDTTPTGSSSNPSLPDCWSYVDEVTSTGYGYVNNANAFSGSNSFRLYKTNSSSNQGQNLILISPQTDNLGNGTKQLRFYARAAAASNLNHLEIVRANGNDATATFTVIQPLIIDHIGYQEYVVPLPVTTDDYFGFRLAHNGVTTLSTVHLDDVFYEDLDVCAPPTGITVTNIGQTSADISWTASTSSGATQYEYEVRTTGDPGSGTTGLGATGIVTGLTASVTGLSASLEYSVYVRSICGTTPGRWMHVPEIFNTLCGVVTGNFYENFDAVDTGGSTNPTVPNCWTYIRDSSVTTLYGYTTTSGGQTGKGFYTYRSSAGDGDLFLISPETNNLGSGTKQLRFSVRVSAASYATTQKFEVYSMNGNTTSSTKTLIQGNFPLTNTWQEFIVPLPNTTDDYFMFSFERNGGLCYIYLDDVYYEEIPAPTITDVFTVDNLCFGESTGMASIVVEGGAEPVTYEWLPTGGNSFTATDLAAGTYTVTVTDGLNRSVTDTITILEPDQLLSNISIDNISCNGNTDGSASVNPSGGVTPYTVVWSTGEVGNDITNLIPGQYFVTITDANNCVVNETFDITEPDLLVATNGGQTNVSNFGGSNGSATVAVTGGTLPYTYSWAPSGGTSDTASNLTAGTYTVNVTDAGGCTADVTFDITQPIPLEVHLVSKANVTCFGENDGEIIVDVTGDFAPYTLSWSPSGGTGYIASNLTQGSYTVTVANSIGETVTGTYTITEPAAMLASVGSIVNPTCNGSNSGSATVTILGGTAPYSFVWSNGETGMSATALTAGSHFVHVTDAKGCQVQENFTVNQPTPILINTVSLTDVTCNGQANGAITIAVNGGVTPYSYSWTNGQTGTSLNNLSGGNYTVTVTDGNGCSEQQTFTIAEPAFVYPPSAVNQSFCSDTNPTLNDIVITGSNIQWYSTLTGTSLLPLTTALVNGATYYATQTIGACESDARTAVQVSLHQGVPLTTATKNVCYNSVIQDVTIDGFNYTQLKWYSNPTSTTALAATTLLATGTYYVSTFTNNVCESIRQAVQVTVAQSVPAPGVTPQQLCGIGNTLEDLNITNAPGATLVWYASGQSVTPIPNTTQALSGTYYVEQIIGTCKSVRVAVPVQVIPVTAPAMTDITTCNGTTIADFNDQIAPTKYVWYVNNTTTTAMDETTIISSGTFYIAEENSGCISNRAQVDVVVNQRPNKPTGQLTQLFNFSATVANLVMNQQGVAWFATEQDALAFTNQLPSNTLLIHQKKYYGVLPGTNNCSSLPTEVTVRINLSTNDLDLTHLKYYPNPTDSELNISYVEAITKVEVFTISGQRVLTKEFDANQVKIDLSSLGSGTYMVRIETETASQFVKVVKK